MLANDERYYECPNCSFMLTFRLKGDKYISYCPYCKGRLEIDKEEYEDDSNDKGISFKHDYL